MISSLLKGKNKVFLVVLIPIASLAYSYWVELNFGEAELKQIRNYLVFRCEDALRDPKNPGATVGCDKLEAKLIGIRGGLYFVGPTAKFAVSNDPSNPDPFRYLIITAPPWIGEYMVKRSGDSSDWMVSF